MCVQARHNNGVVVVVVDQHHPQRRPQCGAARCDSSDLEILAQLISACPTVTARDSDSPPYCVS